MEAPERVCPRCGASYADGVIFCPEDGAPLASKKSAGTDDPYLGLTLADQFQIERLIGIGAMGRVYRAHQRGVDRAVAVKILHRELLRNPTVVARFMREARAASRITHPGVVQVLTTGEIPATSGSVGGESYLVMEHLDGISLRSALAASGGAIPLPRALHVLLQLCDAVGEAHARGVVHRDLKPENVMLVSRGDTPDFVKVLDFGVARFQEVDPSFATQAGVIFGTARYVSPEGAQGKTVESAGDVYSLATVLYECLSGQTPFSGDSPIAILVKQAQEPAPDVRSVPRAGYVPEPLADLIANNLAKNPAQRCPDARALGRAMVGAAEQSGLSPTDLVVRSSLVGSSGRPLQLASLQRTKALALSPDTAARMSAEPPDAEPPRESPTTDGSAPPAGSVAPSSADSLPPPPLSGTPRWLIAVLCVLAVLLISLLAAHFSGRLTTRTPSPSTGAPRSKSAARAEAWDCVGGDAVRDRLEISSTSGPRRQVGG